MFTSTGKMWMVIGSLSVLVCMCNSMDHSKTYLHNINGESVTCNKCKPGEKFLSHCTKDGGNAECIACPQGTFNTHYTIAQSCAPCGTRCKDTDRQEIEKNCTSTANMSCICRDGFYHEATGICLRQTPCPPGKGVQHKGDRYSKTECEACIDGSYFSNVTSYDERCMVCSTCGSGQVVDTTCTSYNDTVCISAKQKGKKKDNLALRVGLPCGIVVAVCILMAIGLFCCLRNTQRGKTCIQTCKQMGRSSHDDRDASHVLLNGLGTGQHFTDEELRNLAADLTFQEYPMFFRSLIEEEADKLIEEKRLDYEKYGTKEVIYQILLGWRLKEKDNATKHKVIEAFRAINRNNLYNKYSKLWVRTNGHSENV